MILDLIAKQTKSNLPPDILFPDQKRHAERKEAFASKCTS